MSFVIDKLQQFEYYESKLPMWLQNTTAFKTHFRIWFDVLISEIGFGDALLEALDIFNNEYSTDSNEDNVLDKLAALFDYGRTLRVQYTDADNNDIDKLITLNDYELALLIKCQIIKNYFDGSRETIEQFYASVGLPVYYFDNRVRLQVSALLQVDDNVSFVEQGLTQNILDMFYTGYMTIESVGIEYRKSRVNVNIFLIWPEENTSTQAFNNWDEGRWGV